MAIAPHVALRAQRLNLRDRYLLARDADQKRKFVVRLTPPGLVMHSNGHIVVWLDPPPLDNDERRRIMAEAYAFTNLFY